MKVSPTFNFVLVLPDEVVQEYTDSGLYIPHPHTTTRTATIVAVGVGELDPVNGEVIKPPFEPNQRVIIEESGSLTVKHDGKDHLLIDMHAILGTITD